MSGGLDSGAVATFAARELAARGERLRAFTATPLLAAHAFTDPERIGDELPRAQAVAAHAGNIDLQALRAGITPLEGIRRMLAITDEPKDAASNAFWLVDLLAAVADAGIGTLLVGRGGNWTISWDGGTSSPLPAPGELPWRDASAINPAFARRLNLAERMRADTGLTGPVDPPSPRDRRLAMLLPGRWNGGCTLAELGAAHGLSLRDPTLDPASSPSASGSPTASSPTPPPARTASSPAASPRACSPTSSASPSRAATRQPTSSPACARAGPRSTPACTGSGQGRPQPISTSA